jgi:hypothetical protein
MKVLQAKGLLYRKLSFYSLDKIGEEAFKLKLLTVARSVPGLAGYYATSSARDVPPKVPLSS